MVIKMKSQYESWPARPFVRIFELFFFNMNQNIASLDLLLDIQRLSHCCFLARPKYQHTNWFIPV